MAAHKCLLLIAVCNFPSAMLAQTQADLFDDSVLHEIRFTMNAASWQKLKDNVYDSTDYTVDNFQWKGPNNLTGTVTNLAIHSRGHGSRDSRKPGLHVSFNTNVKTQTFLGVTDIDLKSNTEDGSLLHERLSMKLFIRMGIPAPREAHTRAYMNGDYIGLYNLVEAVDPNFLTRVFKENNGYLYQYIPGDWAGPGLGWHFEYLGPNLDRYANADSSKPFNPKTHSNAPDTVSLEAFFRTLNQAPDSSFVSNMTPYLDLKPWLTHIAVENYLADFDCINGDVFGANNFYLYRFQALPNGQPPSPLFKFIAWDKDLAFDWTQRPVLFNADKNILVKRLFAIPEYRNAYFEADLKAAILAGGAGGWLEQEATREYNQIKQAAYEDQNKLYLVGGFHVPVSNDDFDAMCKYVIGFAAQRTAFIMQDIAKAGYQVPSNYPQLSDGGFVGVGTYAPPAAGGAAEVYGANFGTPDTTSIYINGFLSPLFFTSGGQVDVQVPWESTGSGIMAAIVNGGPSNIVTATVTTYAPAILAVTHTDGASFVTPNNPASANETLVVYATGLGPVTGSMVTGQLASSKALQSTTQTPNVTIGNASASISFAGLTPGFLGLYQVNVQVPSGVSGAQLLNLNIGGQAAPPATVSVK